MKEHQIFYNHFISLALQLAEQALLEGEVPVGAVIVDLATNEVVAQAKNQCEKLKDATAHAEMIAIKQALLKTKQARLTNHALFVSLEPCVMCAGAIMHTRFKRVYFGALDEKFGSLESNINIFDSIQGYKPEIYGSIQDRKSKALLKNFFQTKR